MRYGPYPEKRRHMNIICRPDQQVRTTRRPASSPRTRRPHKLSLLHPTRAGLSYAAPRERQIDTVAISARKHKAKDNDYLSGILVHGSRAHRGVDAHPWLILSDERYAFAKHRVGSRFVVYEREHPSFYGASEIHVIQAFAYPCQKDGIHILHHAVLIRYLSEAGEPVVPVVYGGLASLIESGLDQVTGRVRHGGSSGGDRGIGNAVQHGEIRDVAIGTVFETVIVSPGVHPDISANGSGRDSDIKVIPVIRGIGRYDRGHASEIHRVGEN